MGAAKKNVKSFNYGYFSCPSSATSRMRPLASTSPFDWAQSKTKFTVAKGGAIHAWMRPDYRRNQSKKLGALQGAQILNLPHPTTVNQ